jgi:hypothetical protein
MPLDLETLCLEILEAKELVANISIRVVDEQHPTPGALPASPDGTPSIGMYY